MYNSVFCLRRSYIVFVNLIFSPGFPLTGFENHQYVAKNMAILFVQTLYIIYIMYSMPHTESMFNKLEFFNEGLIVLLVYIMLCWSGIGDRDIIQGSDIPLIISVIIAGIIVIANCYVMLRLYIQKMKQRIHLAKYKKALHPTNSESSDESISEIELEKKPTIKSLPQPAYGRESTIQGMLSNGKSEDNLESFQNDVPKAEVVKGLEDQAEI